MNKIIFALIAGLCAARAVNAAELSFTDQLGLIPAAAVVAKTPEIAPAPAKAGRYVQVSGYVTLNGNGFVSGPNGGFTSMTLKGWASFRDSTGQITSNSSYINVPASTWVHPNQSVFQTVWPNVNATFYRNGKVVGSTNMTGSVSVSGWPSASFVTLSGSGYLSGSVYVEDEE